ncbi:MAG: hypothetical protein QXX08_05690 [Candidatus Bathyarchaeia archaeon]
MKQKAVIKESKSVNIDGLQDFPLELLGLTPESIERSNGHIKIPIELLPYIKICKTPVINRKKKAEAQQKYLLRLKARESQEILREKMRSTRRRQS